MQSRPWLKSYGEMPHEIDPDAVPSALHVLESAMARYSGRPAFRCFGQALTYADVDRTSAQLASFLQHALGVKKGDRIAAMMTTIPAFPVTTLGLFRAGAAQVNVNPLYTSRELEHQLRDAGCEIIFVSASATSTLREVLPRTAIRHVVVVEDDSALPLQGSPHAGATELPGAISFDDALRVGASRARVPVQLDGHDLAFLQYTGGTTGAAKGAALSHRNIVAATRQFQVGLADGFREGQEVVVTALPMYHIFALAINFISYFEVGAENWLVPNPRDIGSFLATMKAARPTVFTGVNTLFNLLVTQPAFKEVDWSRHQMTVGGGAPVLPGTSERWAAMTGQEIRQGYGLSETCGALSAVHPAPSTFNGTCGLPLPSTDLKLLDDDDMEVEVGSSGEIVVKGPQVMSGYWNQPAATEAAFTADGYFRTGDIGELDAQGFLKIVDRKKDMVLVSGFNVYPNDVETVAAALTGVLECACVGVHDDSTGEAVKLFVVRVAGSQINEADVIAHCRAGLAAYKVPRSVRFVGELPKSSVGKILRRELRGQD